MPNMSSTFRTLITKHSDVTPLLAGIVLSHGPGPTTLRALTETHEGANFAMLVQCKPMCARDTARIQEAL